MKKGNTANRRNKKDTLSKKADWEDYLNTLSLQMEPSNNAHKERLAIKLITWAKEDPDAFCLEQFWNLVGISDDTFYRWCKKSEKLEAAHKFALLELGIKRERISIEKNLNINHVTAFVLPHYHKRWNEEIKWRASLKNTGEGESGVQTVEIPAIPKQCTCK